MHVSEPPQIDPKDPKRWEILNSEYVMRNKWLTVRRDHIRQPTGVEIPDYWVLEYPDWVNVIAETEDGLFVIERQYRHAVGRTDYEICAGCVEPGETPLEAAQRELREETGFTGGEWRKLMTISPNGTSMNNMCHCFYAKGVVPGPANREPTEDIEVFLAELIDVGNLLRGGQITQATMLAPLWFFMGLDDLD